MDLEGFFGFGGFLWIWRVSLDLEGFFGFGQFVFSTRLCAISNLCLLVSSRVHSFIYKTTYHFTCKSVKPSQGYHSKSLEPSQGLVSLFSALHYLIKKTQSAFYKPQSDSRHYFFLNPRRVSRYNFRNHSRFCKFFC